MKIWKVLRMIFSALCALSGAAGLAVWLCYFDKTAECPYCALPEGLGDAEIDAALAKNHASVVVLENTVHILFALFGVFLLAFVITVILDILRRRANFLQEHEKAQWHGYFVSMVAAWWRRHDAAVTVVKCILGVLTCLSGFGLLLIFVSGIVVTDAAGMIIAGIVCLIPMWILLALLWVERKIGREELPLPNSEEAI